MWFFGPQNRCACSCVESLIQGAVGWLIGCILWALESPVMAVKRYFKKFAELLAMGCIGDGARGGLKYDSLGVFTVFLQEEIAAVMRNVCFTQAFVCRCILISSNKCTILTIIFFVTFANFASISHFVPEEFHVIINFTKILTSFFWKSWRAVILLTGVVTTGNCKALTIISDSMSCKCKNCNRNEKV